MPSSWRRCWICSAASALKILKPRCPGPLPPDLHAALAELEAQVNGEAVAEGDGAGPVNPLASYPSPSSVPLSEAVAFAEAREEFTWLVKEIHAAQDAGDLAAVLTAPPTRR